MEMNEKTKMAIHVAMFCERYDDCLAWFKACEREGATLDYDDVFDQALERLKYVDLIAKQKCFLMFFFLYLINKCENSDCQDSRMGLMNQLFSN